MQSQLVQDFVHARESRGSCGERRAEDIVPGFCEKFSESLRVLPNEPWTSGILTKPQVECREALAQSSVLILKRGI